MASDAHRRSRTWIPQAAAAGRVIFSKDAGLRTDPEREAVISSEARVFLHPDSQAPGHAILERYLENRFRIAMRSRRPGPFVYMVRPTRLDPVDLRV